MSHDAQQLLNELHKLLGQFEATIQSGTAASREHAGAAAEQLHEDLKQARTRVEGLRQDLQDELDRGLQATQELVRGQPWMAIGIAAAVAFVVGIVVARRD